MFGLIGAVLSGIGAISQASAQKKAANAQRASTDRQLALNERIYNDQTANFAPGVASYKNALAGLNSEMGFAPGAGFTRGADGSVMAADGEVYGGYQETPYYRNLREASMRAIDASAASRGNLFSSATLRQQQDNAGNIANAGYGDHMSRMFSLAGMGQSAVAGQGGAAQSYGSNASGIIGNQGDIEAAAAIGRGNALSGFTDNLSGLVGYQQGLNGSSGGNGGGLFGGGKNWLGGW